MENKIVTKMKQGKLKFQPLAYKQFKLIKNSDKIQGSYQFFLQYLKLLEPPIIIETFSMKSLIKSLMSKVQNNAQIYMKLFIFPHAHLSETYGAEHFQ